MTLIIIINGVLVRYCDMTKLLMLNNWVIPRSKMKGILKKFMMVPSTFPNIIFVFSLIGLSNS